jgi:hypothetical protein
MPIQPTTAAEPLPIWLSALLATECEATANGSARKVVWRWVSGRAIYTNCGAETELILPFGVRLNTGMSVVVSWAPGDTSYKVELEPGRVAA